MLHKKWMLALFIVGVFSSYLFVHAPSVEAGCTISCQGNACYSTCTDPNTLSTKTCVAGFDCTTCGTRIADSPASTTGANASTVANCYRQDNSGAACCSCLNGSQCAGYWDCVPYGSGLLYDARCAQSPPPTPIPTHRPLPTRQPTATPIPSPTSTPILVPPIPTGLIVSCPAPGTTATVSWVAVAGATAYALRVDDTTNAWSGNCAIAQYAGDVCLDNVVATSYTFQTIAGHTYSWWVHAINSAGWSVAANAPFTCTPVPSTPPPCPLRPQGDANCDQVINTIDYDSVFKPKMNGQSSSCTNCSADFNSDSAVNLLDYEIWRNTFYH